MTKLLAGTEYTAASVVADLTDGEITTSSVADEIDMAIRNFVWAAVLLEAMGEDRPAVPSTLDKPARALLVEMVAVAPSTVLLGDMESVCRLDTVVRAANRAGAEFISEGFSDEPDDGTPLFG